MLWIAFLGIAEAVGAWKKRYDVLVAMPEASPGSPREDNPFGRASTFQNVLVVSWSNGIIYPM